jgi:hypothetical protein
MPEGIKAGYPVIAAARLRQRFDIFRDDHAQNPLLDRPAMWRWPSTRFNHSQKDGVLFVGIHLRPPIIQAEPLEGAVSHAV